MWTAKTDQTRWVPRLIWFFVVFKCHIVAFVMVWFMILHPANHVSFTFKFSIFFKSICTLSFEGLLSFTVDFPPLSLVNTESHVFASILSLSLVNVGSHDLIFCSTPSLSMVNTESHDWLLGTTLAMPLVECESYDCFLGDISPPSGRKYFSLKLESSKWSTFTAACSKPS